MSTISALRCARSALSAALRPPLKALRLERDLPAGVLGPVACFHGDQRRIAAACLSRRSWVQPWLMSLLQ